MSSIVRGEYEMSWNVLLCINENEIAVLPRPVESSYSSHVRLLSSASVCHCDEGDLTGTVRLHALDVAMYPYQYKFIVDGVWLNDPQAQEQVMNPYGTLNSIVRVE